jgi:RHS repeat-associated protein
VYSVVEYDYDSFGNLRSADLNGTNITYTVDPLNRRIGKTVDGIPVQKFIYQNQLNPVAELDGSNNVVSVFIYANKGNVPAYLVKDGVTYRIISDQVGSVRLVVNIADGSVVQRMDYDEFGNVLLDSNPGFQPFGFQGGLYDRDTGLVRFGARDYDPRIGRWLTKDALGFEAGINFYVFCGNDPVNQIDPFGLCEPSDKFSIFKPRNEPYVTGFKNSHFPFLGDQTLFMHIIANLPFIHEISQRHDRQVDILDMKRVPLNLDFAVLNVPAMGTAVIETAVAGGGAVAGSVPVPEVTNGGIKWGF